MHPGEVATETESPPDAGNRAPKRSRRRQIIVVLAGVLVLGAVIALERMVLSADPLGMGGTFSSAGEHRTIEPPGRDDATIYRYHAGAEFGYGFDIVNGGPLPVRVVDIPHTPYMNYYAVRTALEVGDGSENELHGGSPEKLVRFTPFTLEPGQHRSLRLSFRFKDCDTETIPANHPPERFHSGTSWDRQLVHLEILGFGRETELPLPMIIGLEGTIGLCGEASD